VQTDDHRLVKLTEAGLRAARAVMAKRVLLVTFLSRILGVSPEQAEVDSCKIEHLVSDATGHRLAQFLRFVSEDPSSSNVLDRFRRFRCRCPKDAGCGLCKDRCLVDELKRAI
jgi:Mn-dependent DtxR family transcriptional regulator